MTLLQKTCVPCKGGIPPLEKEEADELLQKVHDWQMADGEHHITRTFKFNNFVSALDFVNKVGKLAEDEGHHPDITFGWGYATVVLYTHKIKGLHENDFIMAAKTEQLV